MGTAEERFFDYYFGRTTWRHCCLRRHSCTTSDTHGILGRGRNDRRLPGRISHRHTSASTHLASLQMGKRGPASLRGTLLAHRSARALAKQLVALLVLIEMLPRCSVTHETTIQRRANRIESNQVVPTKSALVGGIKPFFTPEAEISVSKNRRA